VLPLRPGKILVSIDPQQGGRRSVVHAVQQQHVPTQRLGRNASAADCVPYVMLAVAKGPLAVLPRLPPVHRGKADQESVRRESEQQRREALFRQLRSP
jgi:hypothetical protein